MYSGEFLTEAMRSASRSRYRHNALRTPSSDASYEAARSRISDTVNDTYDFRDRNLLIRNYGFSQACDTATPTTAYYSNRMLDAVPVGRETFALEEDLNYSVSVSRMWRQIYARYSVGRTPIAPHASGSLAEVKRLRCVRSPKTAHQAVPRRGG